MAPKKAAAAAAPVAPPPPVVVDPLILFGPDISLTKPKVASAFALFDREKTGAILVADCIPILHSLGIYLTEKEFTEAVLPELLAAAAANEPPPQAPPPKIPSTTHVLYAPFEKKVVELIDARAYEPESSDALLAAFRALDKGNTGKIELDKLKDLFTGMAFGVQPPEQPLSEEEWSVFQAVLPKQVEVDEETEKQKTWVFYEDYVKLFASGRRTKSSLVR
jgi:Ca2+-binding EF-hand superfamily protein